MSNIKVLVSSFISLMTSDVLLTGLREVESNHNNENIIHNNTTIDNQFDTNFLNYRSLVNKNNANTNAKPHEQSLEAIAMEEKREYFQLRSSSENIVPNYYGQPSFSNSMELEMNMNLDMLDMDDNTSVNESIQELIAGNDISVINDLNITDPKQLMISQINMDNNQFTQDWIAEDMEMFEEDMRYSDMNKSKLRFRRKPKSKRKQKQRKRKMDNRHISKHLISIVNRVENEGEMQQKKYINVNDLINDIGFGKFHYQLIFLCGLGYISDSMWASSIALIISPVQREWNINNAELGWIAAILFFGMCIGSFFWGRTSDIVGRKFPFTLTLVIGGIFGMMCSFMQRFELFLFALCCLGFGVGGNIPVDGAILAEFLPFAHRGRIMVSLSVFWALGDLLSSALAWIFIPQHICSLEMSESGECTTSMNIGWRYYIFTLGCINCGFLLFRLGTNESPTYLICQGEGGRRRALNVLKQIAKQNGCPEGTVTDHMILQVDNPPLNRKLIQTLQLRRRLQQQLKSRNSNQHVFHLSDEIKEEKKEITEDRESWTVISYNNKCQCKHKLVTMLDN